MSKCTITPQKGGLLVKTPYNARFVAQVKGLPAFSRSFDPGTKAWLVSHNYGERVQQWIEEIYGEQVSLPNIQTETVQRIHADVLYIGACKERGVAGSEPSAFGFSDGAWSINFRQSVLQAWFGGNGNQTLYSSLGIKPDADMAAIKSAFRRMAMQWHPDHCSEPDAGERFMQIKSAYDVLSDGNKRARYDAGLKLEASLGRSQTDRNKIGQYRSPLRCGNMTLEGVYSVGRFQVSKILSWADIINSYGQTLVVSWPYGYDHFVELWI